MDKFTKLEGVAAPLKMINIDTDMIIPARYLKTIKRTGLGTALFSTMRYKPDGSENPDFVLNKPAYRNSKILVADDNFGCGSSREHAPWALEDYGFRVIIAPSFADIFYNNCFKNGMLPIRLTEEQVEELFQREQKHRPYELTADLETCTLSDAHGFSTKFEVEPFRRHCLLNGLDDIGLTLEHEDKIAAYEKSHAIGI